MTLRCILDGLLLPAEIVTGTAVVAWDGDESFEMEALEALYYEMVEATEEELVRLERGRYRLLKRAPDFQLAVG